jgi:hypothetical protein
VQCRGAGADITVFREGKDRLEIFARLTTRIGFEVEADGKTNNGLRR